MVIVLFQTRLRPGAAGPEYEATAQRMMELASRAAGFVSFRYFTSPDGDELSIVEFESEEALAQWRNDPEHLEAQRAGREKFFESYRVQVCTLVREYGGPAQTADTGSRARDEGQPRPA